MGHANDRQKVTRSIRRTERQTHKLYWTPLESVGPHLGRKYIATLDPQTGNVFVLISSVGVQCRDAFIRFQKFPWMNRQTDIKS